MREIVKKIIIMSVYMYVDVCVYKLLYVHIHIYIYMYVCDASMRAIIGKVHLHV